MATKYCYWSVCDGAYAALMENCVRTARAAGVFKEFHVLTDRAIEGCECYDCFEFEKASGLFKLHYLKVGMSRLNFDYFIWLDADTEFVRNPMDVLEPLGKSPIHLPLEVNLDRLQEDKSWRETSPFRLREVYRQEGIVNDSYLSGSAFWIVHHDAIEPVYDLALGFWHKAKQAGTVVDVSAALGYAMQLLCADAESHRLEAHPKLWATDYSEASEASEASASRLSESGASWSWRHPLREEAIQLAPAIIHRPLIKH